MADYEFKTVGQNNYGWNLTWESTGKFPIIAKRAFTTLEKAQAFVDDVNGTACEGLIIAVFNDIEKNNGIYLIKSVATAENPSGELVKAGSGTGSITADNYTAAKALATPDNIGQLIYVLNEETSTSEKDENDEFVVYSAGPYVVTGDKSVAKLGTTSASGDISGDVEALKGSVSTLQAEVKELQDAEIDFPVDDIQINGTSIVTEGIAKITIDTEFVDNSDSLNAIAHKAIAAKFADIESSISLIPKFSVLVVSELPEDNISTSTIYLVTSGDETNNLYDEYIYITNGEESSWEKLGTQKLDLTNYYTEDEVNDLLLGYVKVEEGKSLVSNSDIAQITTNKGDIATINETISGINTKLTTAEDNIETLQEETITEVSSELTDYLTAEVDADNKRLTKLTPVIGSFKTAEKDEKEGLATVTSVKSFVSSEIDNAFAWVEVEGE